MPSLAVTPAAATGNSGDANGMWAEAQSHPDEANQDPDRRGFVDQGEVYPPGTVSGRHFIRSHPPSGAQLSLFVSNCRTFRTDYGGGWFTECGPQ